MPPSVTTTIKPPGYLDVTRIWNYRNVQSRREERDVQARRFNEATAAEEKLAEIVKTECGFDGIRMRVRAPRYRREDDTAGRGEIDMILVTNKAIYVIEIKDFFGQVYTAQPQNGNQEGEDWIQCARPPGSQKKIFVNHGDILNGIRLKAKAVADYLAKTPIPSNEDNDYSNQDAFPGEPQKVRRLDILPGTVYPCLVFVNPHCVVDPQVLAAHQFVFTTNSFKQFIGQKSVAKDWLHWLAPVTVPSNQYTYNQQLGALAIIDTLPTWDTITFHNGSVRTGDILSFHFPECRVLNQSKIPQIDRRNISDCSMTWPGNSYLGLMWTLVTHSNLPTLYIHLRAGTSNKLDSDLRRNLLTGDAAVQAASVADKNNSSSPMQQKKKMSSSILHQENNNNHNSGAAAAASPGRNRSSMNNNNNNDNSSNNTHLLKFPIAQKPGEAMRSREVAYLTFRSAGQEQTETIAIHHLTSIELSLVSTLHLPNYSKKQ